MKKSTYKLRTVEEVSSDYDAGDDHRPEWGREVGYGNREGESYLHTVKKKLKKANKAYR